jgi:hypothetical protein
MKHILSLLLGLVLLTSVNAQFTGTDSLRNFNNRFIDNNASKAFTNLRLHNLLAGMIDYIDSANGGGSVALGIDTMFITADSVFTYKKNGVFRSFVIRGNPGAGRIYEIPFGDGVGRFANDSNFTYDKSQGANAGRLIVGPTAIQDGGLSKINSTSDNMNALALTSFGTGLNTVVFRRALGSVGLPLVLTAGKDLWNFSGRGYTGTVFTQSKAAMYAQTSQDWTDSTTGTRMYFATTQNDSFALRVRMIIDHDGSIGINDTTPEYGLTVNRSVAFNKDSIPIVGSATSESVLLIDTVNWRVKRVNLLAVDKNIAEDDLSANANHTHNFHGYNQFLDSLGDFYIFSKGVKFGIKQSTSLAFLANQTTPLLIRAATMKVNGINDSISNTIESGVANREFNIRSSDVGSGASSQINFRTPATGISRIEILSDTIQLSSGQILLNEYTPASAYVKTDTTLIKPVGIDAYGNVWRMAGWPGTGGGVTTLQQAIDANDTLTHDNVIHTNKQLIVSGTLNGDPLLSAINTGDGTAIQGISSNVSGTGVHGLNLSGGPGVVAESLTGNALMVTSLTGLPLLITAQPSITNGRFVTRQNNLQSSSTPADGMSQDEIFMSQLDNSTNDTLARTSVVLTNAAAGSQTGAYEIWLKNNAAAMARVFMIQGTGQWTWDGYPALTAQVDTTTYKPVAIDGSGNVVKMAGWPGGGGSTPLRFAQTATTSVVADDNETTLIGSGVGSLVIPANNLVAGKSYRLTVRGKYSTDASNPAQMNWRTKLGSTTIAATDNAGLGTNTQNKNYEIHVEFTCRTTGGSGTVMAQGMFFTENGPGANGIDNGLGTTATIDTTVSNTLNFTVDLTDGSAGNSCYVYILLFEEIN